MARKNQPLQFNTEAFRRSLELAKAAKGMSPVRRLILEQKDEIRRALEGGATMYDIWCSFISASSHKCSLRLFTSVVRTFDRRRTRRKRRGPQESLVHAADPGHSPAHPQIARTQ